MAGSKRPPAERAATAILRHWRQAAPDDRMAHLVKDAWRGLSRAFQTRVGEHSVLFGHWIFLRILWEKDGLTQSELSEEAGLMLPTTFSALATMERLGYVYRTRRPDSRKKVYIHLTEGGRALREILVPLAEEVNTIAVRNVSAADLATTRRTMLTMIQNLVEDEIALSRADRRMPSTRELVHVVATPPARETPKRPPARRRSATRPKKVRLEGV